MKKLLVTAVIALVGTFGAPLVANARQAQEPKLMTPANALITGPSGSPDLYLSPASSQEKENLRIKPVPVATVGPKVREEWRDMRQWSNEG